MSLLEGYLGYSLVDDLLSGMGLAIGYGVGLSLPIIGGPITLAISERHSRQIGSGPGCTSPMCS